MQSLVFGVSRATRLAVGAPTVRLRRVACALAVLSSALGCGSDDDDADTVALADSGSLTALTTSMEIPTSVTVRDGIAWVAESQLDQYPPFNGGVGTPGPFRLVGVPLAGGAPQRIDLPANYFPESVTVSAANRMYVGSVADGAIYTVDPGGLEAREFLPAGTLDKPSVLGLAVSADVKILWVCNTVSSPPQGELPSADLVGIDTSTRQIVATHQLPNSTVGSFCSDVVVAPNGNLWVTESFGGRLFRIPAAEALTNSAATPWLQADQLAGPMGPAVNSFGVNGLALLGGRLFVVNSFRGILLSIDPTLAAPVADDLRHVAVQEGGAEVLLSNPDGITAQGESGILIAENGYGLPGGKRLVRVDLQ